MQGRQEDDHVACLAGANHKTCNPLTRVGRTLGASISLGANIQENWKPLLNVSASKIAAELENFTLEVVVVEQASDRSVLCILGFSRSGNVRLCLTPPAILSVFPHLNGG